MHDQESLALKFGVKISPENVSSFRKDMPVFTQKNLDEGIQTIESEDRINAFFSEVNAGLKARCFKLSAIGSVGEFIAEHLTQNHDIWIEYHTHEIYKPNEDGYDAIHDGLIEAFDKAKSLVTIIDPMPKRCQRNEISLETVERSISTLYGRETGFVVVQRCVP
ncbi:MAG: hypothetical protein PHX43_04735 [Alphaproteobacteria bacterium]|nr:hypothetical protein [Alphaproteobacteria bacterium]